MHAFLGLFFHHRIVDQLFICRRKKTEQLNKVRVSVSFNNKLLDQHRTDYSWILNMWIKLNCFSPVHMNDKRLISVISMSSQIFSKLLMAPSIPSARIPPPPPPPGHLSGILQLCPPQGGAFAVTGQPEDGALSEAILSCRC